MPKAAVSSAATKPSRASETLSAMSKGDSFVIKSELEAIKAIKVVTDRNRRERLKGSSRQYATRRLEEGLRIWRVR